MVLFLLVISSVLYTGNLVQAQEKQSHRARDLGIETGVLKPGEFNAITDVAGVRVGHTTLIRGDSVRTGVTIILPHGGNLFREKVPAAIYVGNGFGKLAGSTQVNELGEIESPIALTNTLNVARVADALLDYMLALPGNEQVRSLNVVVGETNDGWLNDIRGRHVGAEHVLAALQKAKGGPVAEGSVGAGTGTRCLGYKGGIGTASRVLPQENGGYTIGVLVQSNFGGILEINGAPVGRELGKFYMSTSLPYADHDGSIMIVIATDAPIGHRNLMRLAKRALLGVGRTGGIMSNGSGDYVIAFSTVRPEPSGEGGVLQRRELRNEAMSPLFLAVIEATEEAIINSLFMAKTTTGRNQHRADALPVRETLEILKKYHAVHRNETLPSWKK